MSGAAFVALFLFALWAVLYVAAVLADAADRAYAALRRYRVRRYSRTHPLYDWERREPYLSISRHVRIVREKRGAA